MAGVPINMINNFAPVLKKYRAYSFSKHDKGARFGRQMWEFLKIYPVYKDKLKHVWLWNDFPYRKDISGSDVGIGLVCETVEAIFRPSSANAGTSRLT
jgi:predicted helicase